MGQKRGVGPWLWPSAEVRAVWVRYTTPTGVVDDGTALPTPRCSSSLPSELYQVWVCRGAATKHRRDAGVAVPVRECTWNRPDAVSDRSERPNVCQGT